MSHRRCYGTNASGPAGLTTSPSHRATHLRQNLQQSHHPHAPSRRAPPTQPPPQTPAALPPKQTSTPGSATAPGPPPDTAPTAYVPHLIATAIEHPPDRKSTRLNSSH